MAAPAEGAGRRKTPDHSSDLGGFNTWDRHVDGYFNMLEYLMNNQKLDDGSETFFVRGTRKGDTRKNTVVNVFLRKTHRNRSAFTSKVGLSSSICSNVQQQQKIHMDGASSHTVAPPLQVRGA